MKGIGRTAGIKEEVFRSLLVQKIEFYDQNQVSASSSQSRRRPSANGHCEPQSTWSVLRYEACVSFGYLSDSSC